MPSQPNILYLHSHDTGRYVQPYGHAVPTPHLQRFAEQGILFRQAFAAAATCSPSRAALLTGEYPHVCGMHGLASPPWNYRLNDPAHLVTNVLAGHGYTNVLGGVHHITGKSVHDMREHGFHVLLNEDNLAEDVPDLHERAARFLAETPRSPWFFSLGFDQTHRDSRHDDPDSGACFSQPSRYDPKALDGRYVMPPPLFPDGQETRGDMASFKEGARRLDERIGHVLDALDRHGYSENTLVIITTDHGIAWPGMKCNLTDHGIGVTLILRGPGGFSGGRVIDSMVTHLDLFPTMLALADLRPCSWLAGKSLLPLASGVVDPLHDTIFAEQGWHDAPEPQRAIRTTRYKYIRRFIPVGPRADNCDPGPTKKIAADAGFFDRELGDELLFDLRLDPQETWNRVTDPKLGAMRTALRHQLDDWMRRTNDPSLAGKPVPPPGLRGGPARSAT